MRAGLATAVLLALSACATAEVGPTGSELAEVINGAVGDTGNAGDYPLKYLEVRSCRAFEQEPSELLCKFVAEDASGERHQGSAIVTYQGEGWTLLHLD